LIFFHKKQQERPAEQPYRPRTKTYRQASCEVERPLLDKLMKVEAALVQRGHDKSWGVDWNAHKQHHKLMERHLSKNDLPAAFREACRATQLLTEALAQQRNKEEVFQPHWDKTGKTEQKVEE